MSMEPTSCQGTEVHWLRTVQSWWVCLLLPRRHLHRVHWRWSLCRTW
jgi:hypothetical protein